MPLFKNRQILTHHFFWIHVSWNGKHAMEIRWYKERNKEIN